MLLLTHNFYIVHEMHGHLRYAETYSYGYEQLGNIKFEILLSSFDLFFCIDRYCFHYNCLPLH